MVCGNWEDNGLHGFYCNTLDVGFGPVIECPTNEEEDPDEFGDLWYKATGCPSDIRGSPKEVIFKNVKKFEEYIIKNTDKEINSVKRTDEWKMWYCPWGSCTGFYCNLKRESFGPVIYMCKEEFLQKWKETFSDLDPRSLSEKELDEKAFSLTDDT